MARRRRRRKSRAGRNTFVSVLVVGCAFAGWRWMYSVEPVTTTPVIPAIATDRPDTDPLNGGPHADIPERSDNPLEMISTNTPTAVVKRGTAILAEARNSVVNGDLVLARSQYNEALTGGLAAKDELEARAELRSLGQETVFSSRVAKGDPLTEFYTISPGDSLAKIAKGYSVTAELLAKINGIANVNRIQAGRRIKVVHGPFHAKVSKSDHRLDVYCQDTLVEHFMVGLGAEDGTPTGKWVVKNKLKNPTYYPPRGGEIITADDPTNPLGERWIGLEGVGGDAVGQFRYGIHGTIEPDSIGKDASMGCVRLHNEDVSFLFDLLISKQSFVDIVD